ncbi:putative nuclease HARBI1 [Haliotis asinina]|uniref:putative nuclease HARBI1 n=1 Tax=Haliotis asinina TaxID=109174 RepID=UPI0035326B33
MAYYLLLNEKLSKKSIEKQRVFRDRTCLLDIVSDDDLYVNYRIDRASCFELIDVTRPYLQRDTKRSVSISTETQVLSTLRFFSKGGFYSEIGQLHGISTPSVSRILHATTEAICNSLDNIHFPIAMSEQRVVKEGLPQLAGFPRVLGCTDGTLIPIQAPTGDEEPAYVCRKEYHAINVQAVCDGNLRFLSVVSQWPGATHDATVLSYSALGQHLENNPVDGWLLGDSGYPNRSWLLTPIPEAQTRPEERYNTCHCKTRNVIERAFGVLKSRFRCLNKSTGCLPFNPAKCSRIIMACFKLHNFCISRNMPCPLDYDLNDDEYDDDNCFPVASPQNDGQSVRRNLTTTIRLIMEDVKAKARARKSNFSSFELDILTAEVAQNSSYLFGKLSAAVTAAGKKRLWNEIAEKINANANTKRDGDEVRKKWTDFRSSVKKKEMR